MKNRILDRTLSVILVLIILSGLTAFAYNIAVPPITERFTEFYILGEQGKAADYPQNLEVGKEAKVTVGIVNREQETASYRLEVAINGTPNNEAGPIVLDQGQTWQEAVTFRPVAPGDKQKVEFLLYRSGQDGVYRSVYLLVNIK